MSGQFVLFCFKLGEPVGQGAVIAILLDADNLLDGKGRNIVQLPSAIQVDALSTARHPRPLLRL